MPTGERGGGDDALDGWGIVDEVLRTSGGDAQDAAAMPTGERGGGDDSLEPSMVGTSKTFSNYKSASSPRLCRLALCALCSSPQSVPGSW